MISCAPGLHSCLVSQQATEPSLLTPQVWTAPALTETKEVPDGVGRGVGMCVGLGVSVGPGVGVGWGTAVGYGVGVGHGVFVGHGVALGYGVAVRRGVFVGSRNLAGKWFESPSIYTWSQQG